MTAPIKNWMKPGISGPDFVLALCRPSLFLPCLLLCCLLVSVSTKLLVYRPLDAYGISLRPMPRNKVYHTYKGPRSEASTTCNIHALILFVMGMVHVSPTGPIFGPKSVEELAVPPVCPS